MRAIVNNGPRDVSMQDVPDAKIVKPWRNGWIRRLSSIRALSRAASPTTSRHSTRK